jgi:hypothetical protein
MRALEALYAASDAEVGPPRFEDDRGVPAERPRPPGVAESPPRRRDATERSDE